MLHPGHLDCKVSRRSQVFPGGHTTSPGISVEIAGQLAKTTNLFPHLGERDDKNSRGQSGSLWLGERYGEGTPVKRSVLAVPHHIRPPSIVPSCDQQNDRRHKIGTLKGLLERVSKLNNTSLKKHQVFPAIIISEWKVDTVPGIVGHIYKHWVRIKVQMNGKERVVNVDHEKLT